MAKGGYVIVDLKNINISTKVIFPGLYERIESSNGKPILVQNLTAIGVERKAFFAVPSTNKGAYIIPFEITANSLLQLRITDDNGVVSEGKASTQ